VNIYKVIYGQHGGFDDSLYWVEVYEKYEDALKYCKLEVSNRTEPVFNNYKKVQDGAFKDIWQTDTEFIGVMETELR